MKYLLIAILIAGVVGCGGCGVHKQGTVESGVEDLYGGEEIRASGDTTFWKYRERGFLLTDGYKNDSIGWVIKKIDRVSLRWTLWETVSCDSVSWGLSSSPPSRCMRFVSKETEVWYEIPKNQCEEARRYNLLPYEKYVIEQEWCYTITLG